MKNSNVFKGFSAFALVALLAGCGTPSPEEANDTAQDDVVEIVRVEMPAGEEGERYIATLAIDGMGCAMACGSKISGTLANLEGVQNADINFVGAGEENTAIVEFDNSIISEKEMIEAVNNMTGGHYEVKAVSVIHYKKSSAPVSSKVPAETDKVSGLAPKVSYSLPNVFSVFSRLF